ncbi:universal stress protein [Streptomyces sp. NPDC001135]
MAVSACPVVLIPDAIAPVTAPARPATQVTLGMDARHPAERAIDFAFDAAQARGVRLHAVHAWELPSWAAGLPFGVPEEDRATRTSCKPCCAKPDVRSPSCREPGQAKARK